jgi:hypothetical protein
LEPPEDLDSLDGVTDEKNEVDPTQGLTLDEWEEMDNKQKEVEPPEDLDSLDGVSDEQNEVSDEPQELNDGDLGGETPGINPTDIQNAYNALEQDALNNSGLESDNGNADIAKVENIQKWLGDINPNYDPFDLTSAYDNNCGSCAFAVEQRLDGNTDLAATAENIGTPKEMNEVTGMEQVPMSPDEIQDYLISQGVGAHGIVGIDRADGPGHWFNAYYDGEKVVAIDGQTGEIQDWPPDYGDVTNWDISVRKEKK